VPWRDPADFDEVTPIVGVDGCKAGWIAVSFPGAEPRLSVVRVFETFQEIVDGMPADSLIAVDMPIGLPDRAIRGGREADWEARNFLEKCRARVFPVPSRRAVEAFEQGYKHVCAVARETSEPPRAPSKQAYHIFPRILQIDILLRRDSRLRDRVFEVHPEVSFASMNCGAVFAPKKRNGRVYEPGMQLRSKLLKDRGFPVEALVDWWRKEEKPSRVGLDDLLDACACAWSAGRIATGEALVFPDPPGSDSEGLPVAIWA
jgi:threonine dehydratase